MAKTVIQIALVVLAVVLGSALIHFGVGYLTNGMVADRMKEYEQRWKEYDVRVKAMEDEIAQLEKKRDELRAEAKEQMDAAVAVSVAGKQREDDLRKKPPTPGETAAANGTHTVEHEKLNTGGIRKGSLGFNK